MRKTALLLFVPVTLALAACNSGSPAGSAGSAASSGQAPAAQVQATAVTGSVGVVASAEGAAANVSPDASLQLKLVDISQTPSVTLAEKTIQPVGELPVQFELDFDPAELYGEDVVVLEASMVDGPRHYAMPLQKPVLTNGASANVSIKLEPQPTEQEKVLASYHAFQAQLGDMQVSKGTSLGEHSSRAYQIFTKNDHVQYVVNIVDAFKSKKRTETDFAYKEGEPWIVVRKHMDNPGAEPDHIERAGWDSDGKVILRQSEQDGKTSELGEDEVQQLHKAAQNMLKKSS